VDHCFSESLLFWKCILCTSNICVHVSSSERCEKVASNYCFWRQQQQWPQQEIQKTGQSVQAPSLSVNDMFKAMTVEQQIMTELSEAVSEEDKIVVITTTVLNLMKQNGH
jgi:CRISPR/Cas system CSM-associated protein Csm5 (group 7 of RAMP superfamily)